MKNSHILSAVDDELDELSRRLYAMGALVVEQITAMLDAIREMDADAFSAVIARDAEVDARQARIEEQLFSLLARMQPMASDLRSVISGQRVALELERCGDHAKRICKQLLKVSEPLSAEVISRLLWLGCQARTLLQRALETYAHADAAGTRQAWADDAELDRMYHGFLSELLTRMRENSEWVEIGVRLVGIAKSLERIGDHATNIVEEARFVALGEILQTSRSLR